MNLPLLFKVCSVVDDVRSRLDISSIRLTVVLWFFELASVLVSRTLFVRRELGGELVDRAEVDGRQRKKVGRFPWTLSWDLEAVPECELEHLLARHQQVRGTRGENPWHGLGLDHGGLVQRWHGHTQHELDRRVLASRSEKLGRIIDDGFSRGFVVVLFEPKL